MNFGTIDKRILIVLVLILFFADYLWDLTSYLPPDRIQGILSEAGHLVPPLYMAVMALAVPPFLEFYQKRCFAFLGTPQVPF